MLPGLDSLSEDITQTFDMSDTARTKSVKLARDMDLYEKRASAYRTRILLEKQKEAEAKPVEDAENNEEEGAGERTVKIVIDNVDPLDYWSKVV